jgi:hypothetical protein
MNGYIFEVTAIANNNRIHCNTRGLLLALIGSRRFSIRAFGFVPLLLSHDADCPDCLGDCNAHRHRDGNLLERNCTG